MNDINKNRFAALDVMRGLTLALMIVVNTPGSWEFIYWPLAHASWNGVTPTDFVFPFFLFIVGAALYFSLPKLETLTISERLAKILKRTSLLFLVGVFLSNVPFTAPLDHWRILGVLQRIALAYLLTSLLCLYFSFGARLLIGVAILLGYWALLNGVSEPYSLELNLVRQIDLQLLGENHLWRGHSIAFDPEGLLSTFPSMINVLIGYESLVLLNRAEKKSVTRLGIIGISLVVVALIWNQWFPFNKSLWTSSFALLTSGAAILALIAIIYVCRIKSLVVERFEWACKVLGSNPIFIYVVSELLVVVLGLIQFKGHSIYTLCYQLLARIVDPYLASLIFALFNLSLIWLIALILYRKRILILL